MGSIQLALSDAAKAEVLRGVLARSAQRDVVCVEKPDLASACVVVVDQAHMAGLPQPLPQPDKIVLLAASDPDSLKEAWDAGVSSVVSEQDSLNTLVLAILSVCLRTGAARSKDELPQTLGDGVL
jgi:DNA-binding NarL/FixJ family response regulator